MVKLRKKLTSLVSSFGLLLGLLAALPLSLIPTAANAAACANGATSGVYTISPTHGQVFYIDTGVSPKLDAAYVGYKIQTSSAKSNLWVKLSSFTGSQITLANAADEIQQIPSLDTGAPNAKTAYFLLKATGTATATDQTHTMTLYEGNPNRGGTSVYTCDFTFTEIQETIKASANKVQTITVPSNNPALGSLVDVVVTGTTGQPGSGKNPDNDIIWVTPAGFSSWPTSALRLESTSIILDQDGNFTNTTNDQNTYNNQLLITGIKTMNLGSTSSKLNSSSQYKATYSFRVIGPASAAFKVAPVAQISSGNQYKHSDTNSTAAGAFPSLNLTNVASTMTVTKKITATARVTNKSLTSNVVTLTTAEAHGLSSGDVVYVSDVGSPFDGSFTLTAASGTSLSYSVTNADITSTALANNGFVLKKNGSNAEAIIPYEVMVTSTATTALDEIVDTPDTGLNFVTGSARIKDVTRTSFTTIPDPVNDSTESAISPRPKHFTGPFYVSSTVNAYLRYSMTVSVSSTGSFSNTLYAKSGSQIVGTNSTANPKIVINTTNGGIGSISETTNLAPPTVSTQPPVNFAATTATIAGTVDPNGNSSAIKFQWGTSSTLSSSSDATASTSSSSSSDPLNITSDLTGLSANTTYYYRVVLSYTPAGGSLTTINGSIFSFTTNIIGSTSQTITWGTSFPTFNIDTDPSTTEVSNISQSGNNIGAFSSGDIYSSSGLFVELTSSTSSVCTVSTSSNFDGSGNELSVTYTITFLTTGTCTLVASQAGNATYAPATSVTKNITITALYTVTFNGNSSTSGSASVSSVTQSTSGGSVTLASRGTLVKTNYTFSGWNTLADGSGTDLAASATYTPTANITLYAKWTPETYTVSFNGNTNTGGTAPSNQTKTYNVDLTLASNSGSLVRTGYTFAGWNTAANGSGTNYAVGATYSTNAALTLYAKWSANTYTLTYNGNSADSGTAPGSATYTTGSTAITLSGNTGSLVKSGYTFHGWYSNTTGTGGNSYATGSTLTISQDTTVYAHWVPVGASTVTFNKNDGSGTSGSQSASSSTPLSSSSSLRSRTGYTFAGWNTQADGLGATNYAEGDSYSFASDLSLYAKWTPDTYTVTYDSNSASSGTTPSNQTKTHAVDLTLRSNTGTLARTGYSFAGWNTQADGQGTSYAEAGTYTANAGVTLYAQWTANASYTITYGTNDSDGGSAPSNTTGNGSVTLQTNSGNLTRSGYTFNGWSTGTGCSGTTYASGANFTLSANVTLYPCWSANATPVPAPVYVPKPPAITKISAAEVCAIGSQLVINGINLLESTVTLGGTEVRILSAAPNQLQISLPTQAVGTKKIVVTNRDGSAEATVEYKFIESPVYVNFIYPSTYQDMAFTYTFTATNTEKYSIDGVMPAGLTLDPLTGEISGTPTKAGNYLFTIVASNFCDQTYLDVYMFVDKAIPQTYTCSVPFLSPRSDTVSEFRLTQLRKCLDDIYTLSPATVSPVIFISGGLRSGLTIEQSLTHPRYVPILSLITSMNLNAQIYLGAFSGSLDAVQLNIYWPMP